MSVVPFADEREYCGLFSLPKLPNFILFPVAVKPVPESVTVLSIIPELGVIELIETGEPAEPAEPFDVVQDEVTFFVISFQS